MVTTTEGIVLKTQKYADADLIITYLTLTKGIIKTFAKSPLKTKSHFGSSLEPLTHAKITFTGKEHSMPRLIQSDILKPFHSLRENFHDFINVSKLAEILISLTPENIPSKKLFLFLLTIMGILESIDRKQKDTMYLISQIHLLATLGYEPRLKGCGKCGLKSLDFFPDYGTTLCKKCAVTQSENRAAPIRITRKLIKFYSHSTEWSLHASTKLKPSQDIITSLSELIEAHLNHLLKKRLLSSEFLAQV